MVATVALTGCPVCALARCLHRLRTRPELRLIDRGDTLAVVILRGRRARRARAGKLVLPGALIPGSVSGCADVGMAWPRRGVGGGTLSESQPPDPSTDGVRSLATNRAGSR